MHDANAGPGSPAPDEASGGGPWSVLGLLSVVGIVATTSYLAFRAERAGEASFWLLAGGPVLVLAPVALWRARKRGELGAWMRPKAGDFTLGFLGAALLFVGAYAFSKLVTPTGSTRSVWLARLYLQLGDPTPLRARPGIVLLGLIAVATAEELVWRGLVTSLLADVLPRRRRPPPFGDDDGPPVASPWRAPPVGDDEGPPVTSPSPWAWVASAALYSLAYVPAMWALATPTGPNPLLPIAALGAGLVWAGMAQKLGRLPPSIVAHALFDWLVVVMFRLWGESL